MRLDADPALVLISALSLDACTVSLHAAKQAAQSRRVTGAYATPS